jgi:hypothetical protein
MLRIKASLSGSIAYPPERREASFPQRVLSTQAV